MPRHSKHKSNRHINTNDGVMNDDPELPLAKRKRKNPNPVHFDSSINASTQLDMKARRARGKRGILAQLTEMPLDVLFEIFGHLNPDDLLHLTRASKALRYTLLKRSSVSIWKDARSHIEGLPECPIDLSEPLYASLLFDPYCHNCHESQTHTIIWSIYKRYCKKCILSVSFGQFEYHRYGLKIPLDIVPNFTCNAPRYEEPERYCLLTAQRYDSELHDLHGSIRAEWLEEKRAVLALRIKFAALGEGWAEQRTFERSLELDSARQRRLEAIKMKLTECGWAEEIAHLERRGQLSDHKLVKQPKDLTERIWNNIKKPLIEFMEKKKAERLEKLREIIIKRRGVVLSEVIAEYASHQQDTIRVPGLGDVASLEKFRTIIESTPLDEIVTPAHFSAAMDDFADFAKTWLDEKDAELVAMMEQVPMIGSKASREMLGLATTCFQCTNCRQVLDYPRVLVHNCASLPSFRGGSGLYFVSLDSEPWNYRQIISFHTAAYETARKILTDSGLDPDVQRFPDARRDELWFECFNCSCQEVGRKVMRWPMAVIHGLKLCPRLRPVSMQLLKPTPDEALLVQMLESASRNILSGHYRDSVKYVCDIGHGCGRTVAYSGIIDHVCDFHPGKVTEDFDESKYLNNFDEEDFHLHIDASTHLYRPLVLNLENPVEGFQAAFRYQCSAAFLSAMKAVHDAGVRHNDVRLPNLLLDDAGKVAILDFDRADLDSAEGQRKRELGRLADLLDGAYIGQHRFS
ncbi:hypothetical protein Hypma_014301 [Hypsizygus marmoreus]|uniref:F-box domain-containing protein n=1 Tax=Hypsizygus marmoreus TaxID=39966 RepID=A0A369JHY1_HYPMA|nr:hypothetical protein Hypma_014301 [Hypsizygus marmoreus]